MEREVLVTRVMREHVVVTGLLVIAAACFGAGATMLIRNTEDPQMSPTTTVDVVAPTVGPSAVSNSAVQLPNIDDTNGKPVTTARNDDRSAHVTPVNDRLHKQAEIIHSAPF